MAITMLEKLYNKAFADGIHILDYNLYPTTRAICMCNGQSKNIVINRPAITSKAEETVVLSEELAHYETGTLYMLKPNFNSNIERSNRIKYEAQAKHRAIQNILPVQKIKKAIVYACGNPHEAAEYCEITVEFFNEAVEYWQSTGIQFLFNYE